MAKNDFVKPKAAESFPLGHAKENKDASAYTGFKYPSGGGNDIGVYKQPMPNPNGNIAPPTIDITIREDAILVSLPKSAIPSEKIVGNIIDIKKATPISA